MVTYSRPPSAKPPSPLKNSSSGRGAAASILFCLAAGGAAGWAILSAGRSQADDLIGKTAPPAQKDGPGGRQEERAVLGGELVAAQDVHPAVARMAFGNQDGPV